MKIGHYIPGTRIPILSDDEFGKRQNKDVPLLNLAWHISGEIYDYMRKRVMTAGSSIFCPPKI